MRIALHSVIVDGAVDDYRREHARIPDDLVALFDRVGVRDWVIWRSGDRLFHVVDCDDWRAAIAAIDADPANERWQKHIGRFVDGFLDAEGAEGLAPLEQVWGLVEQNAAHDTAE